MSTDKSRKATPRPREWLCRGGGGHEDGEDGIRAMTLSGEALVETLEAYREDLGYDRLLKRDKLARELAEIVIDGAGCNLSDCACGGSLPDYARRLLKLYEEEK